MRIRQATLQDLDMMLNLNSKIMYKNYTYDDDLINDFEYTKAGKQYFSEALQDSHGIFLIALDNHNNPIGYANGVPMQLSYRKSNYFELQNLGVLPEVKRQGVGKKLMTAITDWAKAQGYQKIYLNCYAKNAEALAFYRQLGYQDIDICLERNIT